MYRKLTDTDGQEGVMDGEAQQQLKLRIYEATIEEFREKGFKFTMDDMARRLGVSKKTIYQVVRDKESLFFDTATYIYEQIKRSEQAVMDDDRLTTVEKIKAILIAMPDSYSELDWRQDIPVGEFISTDICPGESNDGAAVG